MVVAAVGQLCSTASMSHNLAQCQVLVRKAVAAGAKALFLPEASDYIASSAAESISLAQPVTTSIFVTGLQSLAAAHSLPINVGIHEPADSSSTTTTVSPSSPYSPKTANTNNPRVKNTLIWIDEHGQITQRYQKLHLFDIDLPSPSPSTSTSNPKTSPRSTGPSTLRESSSVEPGQHLLAPFPCPTLSNLRLGLLICFDVRFPSASTRLRDQGAQALTYPSAFTVATGRAGHWDALLRARALENGCYVFAAAQVGRHALRRGEGAEAGGKKDTGRVSYGHSMIVDPWGRVLAEAGGLEEWDAEYEDQELEKRNKNDGTGSDGDGGGGGEDITAPEPKLITADISPDTVAQIRQGMPLERMARRDVVDVVDVVAERERGG